jgi:hypothetical protein
MLNDVYSFGVWSLSVMSLHLSVVSVNFLSRLLSLSQFLLLPLDPRLNATRDASVPINTLGLVRRGCRQF